MLSEVPEGWSELPFGELTSIVGGTTPKKNVEEYWDSEDVLWATPTDITSLPEASHFLSDTATKASVRAVERGGLKLLPANTVLMTSRATIGYVAIAKSEMSTNQGFANFLPSEKYVPLFLLYLLQSKKEQFVSSAGGSTFKEISKGVLKSLSALLPPLNEQHRIAEILSSVDASIQATQAVIEQAERVKRGLMEELLTGGLGSEAIGRGEVPEGWLPHAPISSYVESKTEKWNRCESLPYIGLEHIEQHSGRLLGLGESEDVTSAKNVFEEGDVLFGKLRPNLRKYWKADRRGICSTDILVLQTYTQMLEGYLFAIVQSEPFLIFAENDAVGTKMPRTSWKRLEKIELPLPPLQEQQRIVQILSDIDELIVRQKAVIEQQAHTKRGLMDDLLTGKVRTV